MKDSMSTNEETIREQTLKIEDLMSIDEHHEELEEAHYFHTINALVELMVVYGFDTVMDSVLIKLGDLKK
jgi:hypothetical protein